MGGPRAALVISVRRGAGRRGGPPAAAAPFLLASAVGYLPQTLVFALLGKGVRVDGAWQLALAAVLFAGSIAIGFWMLRRGRAARAMEEG